MKERGMRPCLVHRATPPGEGGVALFELRGSEAAAVVERVTRLARPPAPGRSRLGVLVDAKGEVVDEVIVTRVAASESWCGVQTWSLAVHGGVWIAERTLEVLKQAGGNVVGAAELFERLPELSGRDEIRVEAYRELLRARTERAAEFLLRQVEGELSAEVRAAIDLLGPGRASRETLRPLASDLDRWLGGYARARRLTHPLRVLITGVPNCGKSTLLNALAGRERAVVSAVAGTTRDRVRETVEVEGFPVELIDSVGLRPLEEGSDPVEREALRRLGAGEGEADVVLLLEGPPWLPGGLEPSWLRRWGEERVLRVAGFRDLGGGPDRRRFAAWVSGLTGEGLDELRRALAACWLEPPGSPGAAAPLPCALFTERQERFARAARDLLDRGRRADLDGVREALVHCLGLVAARPDSSRSSGRP